VENDAAFIECDQALIRDLHAVRIALRFFGKLSAREESVPNRLIASRRRKEKFSAALRSRVWPPSLLKVIFRGPCRPFSTAH
jgi:hypothetical protein